MLARLQQAYRMWVLRRIKRRLMKLRITRAVTAVYSGRCAEMDEVISILAKNDPIQLLNAYIAIAVAGELTEPLSTPDVDRAIARADTAECSREFLDAAEFSEVLDLHRELAEVYWLQRRGTIMEAKLAAKKYEASREAQYSYDNAIYEIEHSRCGPSTAKEREGYSQLSTQLCDTEDDYLGHVDYLEAKQIAGASDKTSDYYKAIRKKLRADRDAEDAAKRSSEVAEFLTAKGLVEDRLAELDGKASKEAFNRWATSQNLD